MSAKHTPGPFVFDSEEGVIKKEEALLASVYTSADFPCLDDEERPEVDAEAMANGSLFAAAPELLEALLGAEVGLEELTKAHNGCARGIDPCPSCITLANVRAAIAKARSES